MSRPSRAPPAGLWMAMGAYPVAVWGQDLSGAVQILGPPVPLAPVVTVMVRRAYMRGCGLVMPPAWRAAGAACLEAVLWVAVTFLLLNVTFAERWHLLATGSTLVALAFMAWRNGALPGVDGGRRAHRVVIAMLIFPASVVVLAALSYGAAVLL